MSQHRDLVTGALGFVGSLLTADLLRDGHTVSGVGKDPAPDQARVAQMRYFSLDLADPEPIAEAIALTEPDTIYHLAAQSSAAVSFTEPRETFASNLNGTLNLLEAVRQLPAAKRPVVIAVGSCEEYGPHPEAELPLTESAGLDPVSPYGVSKVSQTLLCRQYARSYDLPVIIARAFSHTGPEQSARFVFPSFARQIALAEAGRGPTEILTGDLSSGRDFLDVRDVISAYRALAGSDRFGEVFNISSGQCLTIQEGLEILIAQAKCDITWRRDPARCRPSDIPLMVGDNAKLKTATGWSPAHDFRATLGELLAAARKETS